MRPGTSGMNNSFRNPFPVKMSDFLQKRIVFQRGWPTTADRADVLIVENRVALPGGKGSDCSIRVVSRFRFGFCFP